MLQSRLRRAGPLGAAGWRPVRDGVLLATSALLALACLAGTAQAAVTITRAELSNSQLRVEGTGALPNHAISINPGAVPGTSDGKGAFKVQASPYSSSTCRVTVSDGSTSASSALAGCTPIAPPQPAPGASVAPTALSYASQTVGTTSAAKTVTISNTGNAPLSISSAALAGTNPGDYAKAGDTCSGASVAAGAGCTVSITFTPSVAGTRTASLTITDNAVGSPRTISITGTGATTAPPPPPASGPAVSLSPGSLTFAAQDTGTTSAAQSVTVANTGNAPLFINSAAVRGANPLDFTEVHDGCSGLTLAGGTSCSVSVTFAPIQAGTRSGTLIVTDNATGSPHTAAITGTGTTPAGTTPPPLTIDTRFMTCTGGVCDIGAGSNVFVNNFFSTNFITANGTPPYSWSIIAGQLPTGLTLNQAGLVSGSPTATGTSTFTAKVTDATGASASQPLSMAVTGPPPASPPGCQSGGRLTEPLSGPAINGQVPNGEAQADESQLTTCGGFTILTTRVDHVNLPNGTVLWVSLDFKPVGTITLNGGSGAMKPYNLGRFGVSFSHIRVVSHAPPRVLGEPEILTGGFFA